MLTTNFLKTRTSTRQYLDKAIDEEDLKKLNEKIAEIQNELGNDQIKYFVSKNGQEIFDKLNGSAGYKGIMIKAPYYIGVSNLNNSDNSYVKGAYGLEAIITVLDKLNLGSCWVSLQDADVKLINEAFSCKEGEIYSMLAFGYPEDDQVREHKFDDRKGVNEFVFIDSLETKASVEQLEQRGMDDLFHYLRFAPSAYNSQPWRFLIVEDKIELYIEGYKGEINLIDAGIVMYYFDELTKSITNSKWQIETKAKGQYQYIGSKSL